MEKSKKYMMFLVHDISPLFFKLFYSIDNLFSIPTFIRMKIIILILSITLSDFKMHHLANQKNDTHRAFHLLNHTFQQVPLLIFC